MNPYQSPAPLTNPVTDSDHGGWPPRRHSPSITAILGFWFAASMLSSLIICAFGVSLSVAILLVASVPFALLALFAYIQGIAVGSNVHIQFPGSGTRRIGPGADEA